MAEIICPQCKAANKDTARFCSECGASLLGTAPQAPDSRISQPSLDTGVLLQERYRIVKELGRGGFGAVYRAWDSRLNKAVALKENMETSPEAQRQFTREALVLASLSHPNLPRVTDHFSLPGQGQYLVMDFVEGEDLETLVRRQGVVPVEQALTWILQVLEALEYLHGQDPPVFHRDIKPANVRITPKGKAMLVDFGLVKVSAPHLKTTMGARAISPGYAPPEQYGQGRTDARTDLYALAATLYRLVTGQEPPESVQRIAGDALLPAERVNPEVPSQVSQAMQRGMALEPEKRYPTAREFKTALQEGRAAARVAPVGRAKPVVEAAMPAQAQPLVGIPARPVSKPPEKSEELRTIVVEPSIDQPLRTRVVDSEQLAQERTGMAATGAPLKTQVAGEMPATPAQMQGVGAGTPPTARISESMPEIAALARPQASRAFPRGLLFAGIGGGVFVLLVIAAVIALALSSGGATSKTPTADIENTMAARVQATSTKMAQKVVNQNATATAKARVSAAQHATTEFQASRTALAASTAAAKANKTSTAQVRAQATNQAVMSLLAPLGINVTPESRFGPVSGRLVHDTDEYIEVEGPDFEIKNFLVQVKFSNPYSITRGDWDYGIGFRDAGVNQDFRLILMSDRTCKLNLYKGSSKGIEIFKGNIPDLRTNEGETNMIQFVVMDTQGWLFVNGIQVAKLNLSASSNTGTVWIGAGFFANSEISGEATGYSDFTIWELR